jgi:serine-type D-Ala-D-Ala carboxypeptidase (penicillin-binding protein 5/6)
MFKRLIMALALAGALLLTAIPAPSYVQAQVLAPNWIIYDLGEETILDSDRMDQRVPMASLTKVMTGLLVVEHLSMPDEITIVEEDLVGEASIWLEEGDVYTVRTLLHGMMMRSGNDAAAALARAAGGSPDRESKTARDNFIVMMNERARELGMNDTSFENPHGLDGDRHYSTAYDLMLLTREVMNKPRLMQPFSARYYSGEGMTFIHTNQLPSQYDGVLGGKTGWTNNAGLCLIQMVEKEGRILIVVLLGSTFDRWYPDAIDLLDYGWTIPRPATTPDRAAEAFEWWRDRTDGPVERGAATRSWLWGPEPFSSVRFESYREADDGQRMVQYFDKGRMEINDPDAPITSGWYITGGHLARELISGHHQIGDDAFVYRGPAHLPAAGDPDSDGPSYADLAQLMQGKRQDTGEVITLAFDGQGTLRHRARFGDYEIDLVDIDSPTGHGIASVFDEFLDLKGTVVEQGKEVEQSLFSPRYALIGLPITEPAWMRVPVDNQNRDVLLQCFERRCLTYTPENEDDWQVEIGNIGQHHLEWQSQTRLLSLYDRRYGRPAPSTHGIADQNTDPSRS